MFNPKDLYKIILENQKYLENEYDKDWKKALKDVEEIFICPYHSIAYIEKKAIYNDFKMESMASMFPNCPICNPNGNAKSNTQQTQNTTEEPKPKQETKQSESTNPNVTPKQRITPRIIKGNNPNNFVVGTSPVPKASSVFDSLIQFGKDAIDFTWEQGKNVTGGLIDGMSFGLIPHSIGNKNSVAHEIAEWFAPNPWGKALKIAQKSKAWGKLIRVGKSAKKFPKINANKTPYHVQNAINKYKTSSNPWGGKYPGAPRKMVAGEIWENKLQQLPTKTKNGTKITYKEYDVNPPINGKRDAERFLKSSDGKLYYTDSHYGDGPSKNGLPAFVEIINY